MEKELFERRRVAALCAELPTVETRQAMYSVTALWWKRKKILHALRICLYSYISNMQCACAILSVCPAVKYFSTLSHEWGDFRIYIYIYTEHKMCVLIFCTILSETFVNLRRTERDLITSVCRSACTVPVLLSYCNET